MVTSKKEGAKKDVDPDYGQVRLFVYGTLKKNHPNNIILRRAGAKFLGNDSITIKGTFINMGHFPAMLWPVNGEGVKEEKIKGEIWYGEQEMLKSTDILEGYPLFFDRVKQWSDILQRRVWVYYLKEEWFNEATDFIEDGMWKPQPAEKLYWEEYSKGIEVAMK
jgi:gamma-glutamylcyclotransferase (GGCT)/AIG2-like uncharacterized protein YtfP